jgi:hypothetical protein
MGGAKAEDKPAAASVAAADDWCYQFGNKVRFLYTTCCCPLRSWPTFWGPASPPRRGQAGKSQRKLSGVPLGSFPWLHLTLQIRLGELPSAATISVANILVPRNPDLKCFESFPISVFPCYVSVSPFYYVSASSKFGAVSVRFQN